MFKKTLLFLIILAAIFLRFYQLGSLPPSLTWDEVAWGYNSYSLGIDGRDEFGRFLPYDYLESFGDFKPPMYAYLGIIPVKIFGLNEFATRFPSALFGSLTVIMTYFLVKRIFYKKSDNENPTQQKTKAENIALLSALVLAFSPWHLLLSRAAFEANVATFFIVSAVWLFLKGIQEKKYFLIFSFISLVLSMYTFNTARIVAPLIGIILTLGFRKTLIANKKYFLIACITGFLVLLPIINFLISPQAQLRFKEVNIFWNPKAVETINQEIQNDENQPWSKIIHNRRFFFSVLYLRHYFDNLNPNFLFIKGDGNPKFSVQSVGQLYLIELPFFILGLLLLFRKKEANWWLIPIWLLVGIIPAATARETPHALRIEGALPTFQIITAYGIAAILLWSKKQKIKLWGTFLPFALLILFTINFSYFYHTYFSHYAKSFSGEWQYGYKEAINYVSQNLDNYEQIRMTTELGRPYAYYLFYLKFSPDKFRSNSTIERDVFGFVNVKKFDKFLFEKDLNKEEAGNRKILYINDNYNVPKSAHILKTFNLLNGTGILTAYTL